MKRWIALLLSVLMLFSLTACDEDKEKYDEEYDEEYEIFVNSSEEWHPFPGKTNVEFSVSDEYVIACQTTPSKISFTGKQVGKSVITATVDGEEKKALFEVKRMVAKDEEIVINYAYNPPQNNYYLRTEDENGTVEAVGRIDSIFAQHYSGDFTYYQYYSDETKMHYEYDTSKQLWQMYMDSKNDAENSYKEFQDGRASNAANHDTEMVIAQFETIFMRYFRQYGLDESRLVEYYVGTDTVLGVECWVFDGKGLNGIDDKYWVDPSNGCTLKVESKDGSVWQLTHYDLDYTEWSSDLIPQGN